MSTVALNVMQRREDVERGEDTRWERGEAVLVEIIVGKIMRKLGWKKIVGRHGKAESGGRGCWRRRQRGGR